MSIKAKVIVLALLLILLLSSCADNVADEHKNENYVRRNIIIEASLSNANGIIDADSVVNLAVDDEYCLSMESKNGKCLVGIAVLVNGVPAEFQCGDSSTKYYEIAIENKEDIRFSLPSSAVPSTVSDIDIVVLTNRDYYPEHPRDSLNEYLFAMRFKACGSALETRIDKCNTAICDNSEKSVSPYFTDKDGQKRNFFYIAGGIQKAKLAFTGEKGNYIASIFDNGELIDCFSFENKEESGVSCEFMLPASASGHRLLYAIIYDTVSGNVMASETAVLVPYDNADGRTQYGVNYSLTLENSKLPKKMEYNGETLHYSLNWTSDREPSDYPGANVYFLADGICRPVVYNGEEVSNIYVESIGKSGKIDFDVPPFTVHDNEFDMTVIIVPTLKDEPYVNAIPSDTNFKIRCHGGNDVIADESKSLCGYTEVGSSEKSGGLFLNYFIGESNKSPHGVIVNNSDMTLTLNLTMNEIFPYANVLFILNGEVTAEFMPINSGNTIVMKSVISYEKLDDKNRVDIVIIPDGFSPYNMYDRESFIIIKSKENIVSFDGMPESGTAHKTEFKDGIYTFTRVER